MTTWYLPVLQLWIIKLKWLSIENFTLLEYSTKTEPEPSSSISSLAFFTATAPLLSAGTTLAIATPATKKFNKSFMNNIAAVVCWLSEFKILVLLEIFLLSDSGLECDGEMEEGARTKSRDLYSHFGSLGTAGGPSK